MANDETLQDKFIRELLDPRSALSPREVAAREEILELRRQLAQLPTQKANDAGKREAGK